MHSWPGSAKTRREQVQHTSALLDQLVGTLLEPKRHVEVERLGRLEIDH
jgi:hypothetical protein